MGRGASASVAFAVGCAWLSWQNESTWGVFSGLALAADIAAIVTVILGRRAECRIGATPNELAFLGLVFAVLMLLGFAGSMVLAITKPIVK